MTNTPLPTTDQTATNADKTVGVVVNGTEILVEQLAEKAAPWLLWPVINQCWKALLDYIFGAINYTLGMVVGFVVMDAQKYFALKAAVQAQAALNAAKLKGDKNEISQADQALDAAVASCIHFVGVIKP